MPDELYGHYVLSVSCFYFLLNVELHKCFVNYKTSLDFASAGCYATHVFFPQGLRDGMMQYVTNKQKNYRKVKKPCSL